MAQRLWSGRFDQDMSAQTLDYTQTVDVDARMLRHDLLGGLAHVLMTTRQGIIPTEDGRQIVGKLLRLLDLAEAGKLELDRAKEDVHLNIESMVIAELGCEVGGKLHTARSRNDQVVTDTRLCAREEVLEIAGETAGLAADLLVRATDHLDDVILGYTHSQAAQPVSFGFWLSGHASTLIRDVRRLSAAARTVNENPLGACAIAGTSFPIDRDLTTRLLGFDRPLLHALDATSARDFLIESVSAMAMLTTHLSRMSEEVVVWSSHEYRLIDMDDQFATGSSIMPQKKNPVVAELARARAGTVTGCLVELLTLVKGLALGYSSDLQQDKPPAWRAFDTTRATVSILRAQARTLRLNADRAEINCWDSFSTATELANHLVRAAGWSFRDAYRLVGELVKDLSKHRQTLADAPAVLDRLAAAGVSLTTPELADIVNPRRVLARQVSAGGTGPTALAETIRVLRGEVAELQGDVSARDAAGRAALKELHRIAIQFSGGRDLHSLLGPAQKP